MGRHTLDSVQASGLSVCRGGPPRYRVAAGDLSADMYRSARPKGENANANGMMIVIAPMPE